MSESMNKKCDRYKSHQKHENDHFYLVVSMRWTVENLSVRFTWNMPNVLCSSFIHVALIFHMLSRTSLYTIFSTYISVCTMVECNSYDSAWLYERIEKRVQTNPKKKTLNWKEKYHGRMKRQKDRKKEQRTIHTTHIRHTYISRSSAKHTLK